MEDSKQSLSMTWPQGAGEMARCIRTFEWGNTPLGAVASWPDRLRHMVELVLASPAVSSLVCGPERILVYNDAAARLYGSRHPAALGRPLPDMFPEGWATVAPLYAQAFAGNGVQVSAEPLDTRGAGRATDVFDATLTPIRDETGQVTFVHMTGHEISARLRMEAALRESEARFRHMADSAPALIWMTEASGELIFANLHYDHVFGRPNSVMLGQGWKAVVHPDDISPYSEVMEAAIQARHPYKAEIRMLDKAGAILWFRCEGVPRLDHMDRYLGYTGCGVDVTEARLAAEELEHRVAERTAELMAAEETVRQAQKMEAVGQLTGGLAHDFNNMLQGIAGSLELTQKRLEQGRVSEAERFLVAAQHTVQRAAGLTHRLLAFARRQALQPESVDPGKLVQGMADLIQRTVGPIVRLELALDDEGWSVLCDPNQLESALLNLCINARDAMPEGGTLMVRTRRMPSSAMKVVHQEDVLPSDYVEVAVTDTGTGMDEITCERVFEPFFTTKPAGQGTGLGLSQVYGFVRQSNGWVKVDSMLERGTTVRFYLPRGQVGESEDKVKPFVTNREQVTAITALGTVLLVEDEVGVRETVAEHLREGGYKVLEAADSGAALRIVESRRGSRIDILVTDVGLPVGLNGRQLADAVRMHRVDLPVLLITGYAGQALEERLASRMAVMIKPFPLNALVAKIGEMLAS